MQIAFAIIGFECLPAAKCYMCAHKPIFSGPQTLWKWVSHWRCVGNESLAAQQPCKPLLFRSGRLVWFQSLSSPLVRRRGDSWIAMVGRHPARQKPRWRLAVWAQLALQHLVTFISMPLTPGLLVLLIQAEHWLVCKILRTWPLTEWKTLLKANENQPKGLQTNLQTV